MMIIRVPALALPHVCSALAGPGRPVIGLQGRGAARAEARDRRAAPRQSQAPARVGRPGGPRRADPAPAGERCGYTGWSRPAPSCAGTAAWSPASGSTRTGQDDRQSARRSPRSSSGSPPRTAAGVTSGSRVSCSNSAPGQRIHRPQGCSAKRPLRIRVQHRNSHREPPARTSRSRPRPRQRHPARAGSARATTGTAALPRGQTPADPARHRQQRHRADTQCGTGRLVWRNRRGARPPRHALGRR